MVFSTCVFIFIFIGLSYKITNHIVVGPTLLQDDIILANHICNYPISKLGHILRYGGGQDLHTFFWRMQFNSAHVFNKVSFSNHPQNALCLLLGPCLKVKLQVQEHA
jgi:hypothetical protein